MNHIIIPKPKMKKMKIQVTFEYAVEYAKYADLKYIKSSIKKPHLIGVGGGYTRARILKSKTRLKEIR